MNASGDADRMTVRFHLNGEPRTIAVRPDLRLVAILRDLFGLMATKASCDIGRCGSCLALMDGEAVNGCLVMAWQIEGAAILSPEGLDALPEARIVRDALVAEGAFQCGYCAPGFTVALTGLFRRDPRAGETAIREALEGNLCRCTGYASILRGAVRAGRLIAGGASV